MRIRLPGPVLLAGFLATTAHAEPLCITNTFEVAWVHPGIEFFANPDGYACSGPSIRVKQDETGCFDEGDTGGPVFLAGHHAVDGSCVEICHTDDPRVTVGFDLDRTYACVANP